MASQKIQLYLSFNGPSNPEQFQLNLENIFGELELIAKKRDVWPAIFRKKNELRGKMVESNFRKRLLFSTTMIMLKSTISKYGLTLWKRNSKNLKRDSKNLKRDSKQLKRNSKKLEGGYLITHKRLPELAPNERTKSISFLITQQTIHRNNWLSRNTNSRTCFQV